MNNNELKKHFDDKIVAIKDIWKSYNNENIDWRKKIILFDQNLIRELIGWSAGIVAIGLPLIYSVGNLHQNNSLTASVIILLIVIIYGILLYKGKLFIANKKLQEESSKVNELCKKALQCAYSAQNEEVSEKVLAAENQINVYLLKLVEKPQIFSYISYIENILEVDYYILFFLGIVLLVLSFIF